MHAHFQLSNDQLDDLLTNFRMREIAARLFGSKAVGVAWEEAAQMIVDARLTAFDSRTAERNQQHHKANRKIGRRRLVLEHGTAEP